MAQALVKFLDNQYLEVDGEEHKFVKGIFRHLWPRQRAGAGPGAGTRQRRNAGLSGA
jgi:TPP-dependent trihydroxycyclohexane-1,2-dione (THcHDO) dehydratase